MHSLSARAKGMSEATSDCSARRRRSSAGRRRSKMRTATSARPVARWVIGPPASSEMSRGRPPRLACLFRRLWSSIWTETELRLLSPPRAAVVPGRRKTWRSFPARLPRKRRPPLERIRSPTAARALPGHDGLGGQQQHPEVHARVEVRRRHEHGATARQGVRTSRTRFRRRQRQGTPGLAQLAQRLQWPGRAPELHHAGQGLERDHRADGGGGGGGAVEQEKEHPLGRQLRRVLRPRQAGDAFVPQGHADLARHAALRQPGGRRQGPPEERCCGPEEPEGLLAGRRGVHAELAAPRAHREDLRRGGGQRRLLRRHGEGLRKGLVRDNIWQGLAANR
mmetsp:Transcript_35085/g.111734  ORF Transcript_35085/g.111734 Transcript_35085/m.111734 type:complete len:337 (-) Transcript_35085:1031-2041(-)